MASQGITFETGHAEMIHDVQLDYYSKRLATASSDRTIRIFDILENGQQLAAELKGHEGPVWQVSWAHPKFGSLLASCSYDGRVIVWKEQPGNQWVKAYEDANTQASVNSVAWAPHTFGLVLAAAAADGSVTVLECKDANWSRQTFMAHKGGCNAVSWGPDVKQGSLLTGTAAAPGQPAQMELAPRRFVTAGCDNCIRIWRQEQSGEWSEQKVFASRDNNHDDWVRDVAWAPSVGLPTSTIASCSEDKSVIIWIENAQGQWRKTKVLTFDQKVWRVSWSVMGNILAVSQGDNAVSLWKESVDGEWKQLSSLKDGQPDLTAFPVSPSVSSSSAQEHKSAF